MVSAHFAVPVVGVVVCAVLVFAFGFKSPVQPPSFDLLNEDDHRKYKRSRQKKHNKTNLDGQMIFIDGHGSPGTKATGKQQVTINKHVTNEKYDALAAKMKIKKTKQASDFEASNERFGEERDIEVTGEWTMAVSKKDRKNRGKKDDYVKIDESTSPADEVPKVTTNNNQAAVNSRETNCKTEEVTSNRTYRKNMEVTVTAPAPLPTSEHLVCNVTSTESDFPSVNVNDYTNTTKTTVVRVSVATGSSVTVSQGAETTSSNTKPLKSDVALLGTEIQILSDECVKAPSNSSVKASSGAGFQSGADLPKHCTSDITVRETKSIKSPKKKKKSPESRENYKESPVVTIPGDAKGASSAMLEPKAIVEPEKSDVKREEIEASPKACANDSEAIYHSIQPQADSLSSENRSVAKTLSSSAGNAVVESSVGELSTATAEVTSTCDEQSSDDRQPSSDNPSPDDSQTSVIADELGDWQQAKPLKKKRRPQKESWD